MAALALVVAVGLAVMAGYVARSISGPAATHTNAVSTESRACPIDNCNLRSVSEPARQSEAGSEPAYQFDGPYGLVP
jgi:hypothetical protein